MAIYVCIGSSCHLRGSAAIIERLEATLAAMGKKDKIQVAGSFCMGNCSRDGVSVKFEDGAIESVNEENFDEIFRKHVKEE